MLRENTPWQKEKKKIGYKKKKNNIKTIEYKDFLQYRIVYKILSMQWPALELFGKVKEQFPAQKLSIVIDITILKRQ